MLYTIGEIVKRFRTEGACYKFKPQTITYMAKKLGYSPKRIGGKIGYNSSLMTAISRHFKEAVEYDKGSGMKTSQKSLKHPNIGDYYTYNGERDNKDYEWELKEERNMKKFIRLTEQDLHRIVKESALKAIKEMSYMNEWYREEDISGEHGRRGMFRTYDTDGYTLADAINDAKNEGFDSLEEYLEDFADNLHGEWCWGSDRDYTGGYKVIAKFNNWIVKEWNGQLILAITSQLTQLFNNSLES